MYPFPFVSAHPSSNETVATPHHILGKAHVLIVWTIVFALRFDLRTSLTSSKNSFVTFVFISYWHISPFPQYAVIYNLSQQFPLAYFHYLSRFLCIFFFTPFLCKDSTLVISEILDSINSAINLYSFCTFLVSDHPKK